jgi:hypothetical protein
MMNDKPKPPVKRRKSGLEILKQIKDKNELCDFLENNPSIKLTGADARLILANVLTDAIEHDGKENISARLKQMYCRLLKDIFLSSLEMAQYSLEENLHAMRQYYEKLNVSGLDFITLSLKELIKERRSIIELFYRNDIFQLLDINLEELSSNQASELKTLFLEIIKTSPDDALFKMLIEKFHISNDEIQEVMLERIKLACARSNIEVLKEIYSHKPEYFEQLLTNKKLSWMDKDFLRACIKHDFPESFGRLRCYDSITTNSSYPDMLLTCAALKSNNDSFDTVVLDGMENLNELQTFCEFIKHNLQDLDGKRFSFIMSGKHWVSGEIFIDNGNVQAFLIDPLGKQSIEDGANFPKKSDKTAYRPDEIIASVFPNAEITIPENKIQHANNGCWVYAIDMVRKLPKATDKASVLLSILRNTQSLTAINKYTDKTQHPEYAHIIDAPINKAGLTFMQSVQQNTTDLVDNNGQTKIINQRIEYKFSRLKEKVWGFLKECVNNDLQLENKTDYFKLHSFMLRHDPKNIKSLSE